MNKISYDERVKTYTNALVHFGEANQLVVALEEMSECQKEICKVMRGQGDLDHLADEGADSGLLSED